MMLDGEMMEILKDLEDRYTEAAVILEGLEDDRFSKRAEALKLVREKLLLPDWCYVSADGNPDKPGIYYVIVIYSGWDKEKHEATDERFAEMTTRLFDEYDPSDSNWVMEGQPKEGIVWYEEVGSNANESVYAWLPMEVNPADVTLPDGVKWA